MCLCMQANRCKHVRTLLIGYRSGGTLDILRNLRARDGIAGRWRGSSACQHPGDLPALRVACRCSPVGFDWQQVQKGKPSQVTRQIYMVSGGNFVNIWEINGFFPFEGSFHYLFCHEFSLILKSKLTDLNSRLGGCGICVLEIYFSNFLENNEGKRLKWPSA